MNRFRTSVVAFVVLTTVWACSSSSDDGAAPSCASTEIIAAATSDYQSSVVCGAPPCELGPRTTGADLGGDPSLATSQGRVFFVARLKDSVFELDPKCGNALVKYSVVQNDVKGAANVHDVAASKDRSLFVVLYNVPRIIVLKDGKQDGAPIDLSMYDDDKNPQADAIRIVEVGGVEKAFVTLERLDDTQPGLASRQSSKMLRIDVATRQVEAVIDLAGRNPFNALSELNGRLFMAEPRNFDADDDEAAGIERFDTATSTTQLLVKEQDLGGSVAEVAVTEGCGAAIVAGKEKGTNPTSLVTFDPETGQVLTTASAPLLATPGYELQALAWKGDTLYVGDRRRGSTGFQVHAFERDPGTCNLRETGRGITLPQGPVAIRAASR